MKLHKLISALFIPSLLTVHLASAAEEEINIRKHVEIGGTPPTWISISGFTGEALEALQFDLYVQGFNFTNASGADYLLTGNNNGNLQGRATDKTGRNDIVPT